MVKPVRTRSPEEKLTQAALEVWARAVKRTGIVGKKIAAAEVWESLRTVSIILGVDGKDFDALRYKGRSG